MSIPLCTACGQTVDYLRNCHSGSWTLFSDSADLVKGRYYFSPPDTPVFGGFHILGSKVWDNNVWVDPTPVGQVWSEPSNWIPGELPAEVPSNPENATIKCLATTTSIVNSIPYADTIDGWPPSCFDLPPGTVKWHLMTSFERCSVQLLWAWVICELYENNLAAITNALQSLLDDDVSYQYVARLDPYPRYLIAACPRYCIVAIEGTDTFQQIAEQGWNSPTGPTSMGAYSTLQLWQDAALRVVADLRNSNYVVGTPILFTGHSYGGCVALIASAILRVGNNKTNIRYITYGCPSIGDTRLSTLLSQCAGICIGNTRDIVPAVPFGLQELGTALPLVGPLLVARLDRWIPAPRQALMHSDGSLSLRSRYVPVSEVVSQIMVDILLGVFVGPTIAHPIREYIRRIMLRCPVPSYPILDESVYGLLGSCVANSCINPKVIEVGGPSTIPMEGDEMWVRCLVPAGNFYLCQCNTEVTGFADTNLYWGPCEDLEFIGEFINEFHFFVNGRDDNFIIFQVTRLAPGPFDVVITVTVFP